MQSDSVNSTVEYYLLLPNLFICNPFSFSTVKAGSASEGVPRLEAGATWKAGEPNVKQARRAECEASSERQIAGGTIYMIW